MGDAGYRGVSADQDGRYRNKEQALLKKLASSGQFPPHFDQKVDIRKVSLEVMRPWISEKIGELLGFEDDVVVEYANGLLEDKDNVQPDPRKMQLSLTGFLESKTSQFMSELWFLLLSAQNSVGGIPQEFVERKKREMREARERDMGAIRESGVVHPVARSATSGRGGHRGRGAVRESRWDSGASREFRDKGGNMTQRVQDSGWGSKGHSARPEREDPGFGGRRRDPYPKGEERKLDRRPYGDRFGNNQSHYYNRSKAHDGFEGRYAGTSRAKNDEDEDYRRNEISRYSQHRQEYDARRRYEEKSPLRKSIARDSDYDSRSPSPRPLRRRRSPSYDSEEEERRYRRRQKYRSSSSPPLGDYRHDSRNDSRDTPTYRRGKRVDTRSPSSTYRRSRSRTPVDAQRVLRPRDTVRSPVGEGKDSVNVPARGRELTPPPRGKRNDVLSKSKWATSDEDD